MTQEPIAPGRYLAYRKPEGGAAGSWLARSRQKGKILQTRLGTADDFQDGVGVLTFAQAQDMAGIWFKQKDEEAIRLENGEPIPNGPFTVEAAWDLYSKAAKDRGMKSLASTANTARAHILPALGNVQVDRLTKKQIDAWKQALAEAPARKRTKRGAKKPATRPAPITDDERRARKDTANRILTVLKALLNHAKAEGMTSVSGEAWRETRPFKETTSSKVRFLSVEESQRLVNACPKDFRRLVMGAMFTGARFGELTRLQVRDFDTKAQTIKIAISKSGKPRHVVLTAEGSAFFEEVTAGQQGVALIFMREAFPDMRRVLPKSREPVPMVMREWRSGDQSRLMQDACKRAGLEVLGFHELRHSYASALVNAGCPLAFIAEQLGHSGTRMVEQHYGHLAPSAKAEAIRLLSPKLGIFKPGKVAGLKIKKA